MKRLLATVLFFEVLMPSMNIYAKEDLTSSNSIKVIMIHGNGKSTPHDHWFPLVQAKLEEMGLKVVACQFPDAELARATYWLPFLKDELKADQNTIFIGHSSGAVAAMRYAEENRILGTILVGASHTDLGLERERLSGYFDEPWQWEALKNNQQWIIQFASVDDPWIPIEEARFIHQQLGSAYYEFENRGHFGCDRDELTFPELIEAIKKKLSLMRDVIDR